LKEKQERYISGFLLLPDIVFLIPAFSSLFYHRCVAFHSSPVLLLNFYLSKYWMKQHIVFICQHTLCGTRVRRNKSIKEYHSLVH